MYRETAGWYKEGQEVGLSGCIESGNWQVKKTDLWWHVSNDVGFYASNIKDKDS